MRTLQFFSCPSFFSLEKKEIRKRQGKYNRTRPTQIQGRSGETIEEDKKENTQLG